MNMGNINMILRGLNVMIYGGIVYVHIKRETTFSRGD